MAPFSVKFVWEKITTPDIFGHQAIVTNGPIIRNAATGLEQIPTIIFDPDKVSALSPEEFDFELYHAITHLIQGDHDKLHLLKDAVGAEKFNQYTQSTDGKKYLNALEESANFLLPIKDAAIATVAQKGVLQNNFNALLNAIKKRLDEIEPIHKKSAKLVSPKLKQEVQKIAAESFIQCPNPTEEIRDLLRIKSLSTFEKYIQIKKISVLKEMGFTNEEINTVKNTVSSNLAQFMQQYKQGKEQKDHDPTIPTDQLEIADQLFRKLGLESSSIPMRSINPMDEAPLQTLGSVRLESLKNQETRDPNNLSSYMQQILYLKPINDPRLWNQKVFTIAHEIGHLVKGHAIEKLIIKDFSKRFVEPRAKIPYITESETEWFMRIAKYDEKMKLLFDKELIKLYELEADIWVATMYQKIAEIIRRNTIQVIQRGASFPDIYLSTAEQLYVFTHIIQLHKKAALKDKGISDTTKE